jgi:Kef-type K+ transport system membrane component KefB
LEALFYVGLIFVLGALMKWVSLKFNVLYVVGYLTLGFLLGPKMYNVVPQEFIDGSHVIIDLSLALISVLVGANLKYNLLKDVWRQIVVISVFEAFFTFLFIGVAFYVLFDFLDMGFGTNYQLTIALIFGALASATAPATILAVIHQLNIKNKFSSFLLAVVATDNAITLILFSLVVISTRASTEFAGYSYDTVFVIVPIIFFTILIGVVGAVVSEIIDRVFANYKSIKTTSTLGMIFLVYSLSKYFGLDPMLASLVMGVVMANISKSFYVVKEEFDYHLQDIIFLLFFTISAMHLNIEFILYMPWVICIYVLFRVLGKVIGVYIGGKVMRADKNIQKYLGVALFPQAGIAIGLSLSLQSELGFETVAPIVLNIIIATTMIHEFIGPLVTKYVLEKISDK